MKSQILVAFELTTQYCRRIVDDLPDADFCHQPAGVANHPAWLLGHLCYSFQAIGGEIGIAPWLPKDWGKTFGTGSVPTDVATDYPSRSSLVKAFEDATEKLRMAIAALSNDQLESPLPDEDYRKTLPTLGHALTHILIGHASIHVGQLTVWRAAMGLPRISEQFDKS